MHPDMHAQMYIYTGASLHTQIDGSSILNPSTNLKLEVMKLPWPFDQAENVAAVTTRQVLREGFPILKVVHYSDDHSWAFTCGTTNDTKDGQVVAMASILDLDGTLREIADLSTGWVATRENSGAPWRRYEGNDF